MVRSIEGFQNLHQDPKTRPAKTPLSPTEFADGAQLPQKQRTGRGERAPVEEEVGRFEKLAPVSQGVDEFEGRMPLS